MLNRARISGRLLLLQTVPLASVFVAVLALAVVHERYQHAESGARAREVSQFEMARMTAMFNYRLNELREELLHVYGEQMNLARALSEGERERLVFYRRDHLLAYGVLVPSAEDKKWQLHKSFLRDGWQVPNELFQEAMAGIQPPGFWLKRIDEGYAIAFVSSDHAGKPFGLVGVFKFAHVFPFCRFFSDALGAMSVTAFVLDDRGKALCHSQGRFENTLYKDYAFYSGLRSAPAGLSQARYSNVSDTNVTATLRRIVPGDVLFVAEAAEVSPWLVAVPWRSLAVGGGAVLIVTLLSAIAMSIRLTSMPRIADKYEIPIKQGEVQEFSKLRHEVNELAAALLETQSTLALVSGFQKGVSELPAEKNPAEYLIQYLSGWDLPMYWFGAEDPKIVSEIAADPHDMMHSPELKKRLSEHVQHPEIVIYPVMLNKDFFGVLVLKAPREEQLPYLDVLPQLTQIMALAKRVGRA